MIAQTSTIGAAAQRDQTMSALAAFLGAAKKRLTDGSRFASLFDVKVKSNANGAIADVSQSVSGVALLGGAAEKRLTGGVRCASVVDMKVQQTNHIARGRGLSDLIWWRTCYVRVGMFARGIVSYFSQNWSAGRYVGGEISISVVGAPAVPARPCCGRISSMSAGWFSLAVIAPEWLFL